MWCLERDHRVHAETYGVRAGQWFGAGACRIRERVSDAAVPADIGAPRTTNYPTPSAAAPPVVKRSHHKPSRTGADSYNTTQN